MTERQTTWTTEELKVAADAGDPRALGAVIFWEAMKAAFTPEASPEHPAGVPDTAEIDDLRELPSPVEFTIEEGGTWLKWGTQKHVPAFRGGIHAIKFLDGSEFDAINGWRHVSPSFPYGRITPKRNPA